MEQEEKLYDEVETVREMTYLGDRLSVGGGCADAVSARTRCGWIMFRECGELLHDRRFPFKPKGAVNNSYVWPAILYRSEAWRLKEILTFYEGEKDPCRVQPKDRKRYTDFMFMLDLN